MSLRIFSRVGRLAGKSLRGAIRNFCYLRMSRERPLPMYAHSKNVSEEDLLGGMSYPSNNDFVRSVLINEGRLETWFLITKYPRDSDLITCGNLLLFRKRMSGKRRKNVFY